MRWNGLIVNLIRQNLNWLIKFRTSDFGRSNVNYDSRRFVLTTIIKPDNFNELFNFNFNDRLLREYQNISFKGLESSLFFKSYDELVTINSNKKRCLTTCVITTPAKIARLFLEVFLRILVNGCYDFTVVLSDSILSLNSIMVFHFLWTNSISSNYKMEIWLCCF